MNEICWNCQREIPATEHRGIVVVILEARELNEDNVVRRCCGPTCARHATVWNVNGREKDKTHSAHYDEVWA